MTFDAAETKVARLAAEENIYILIARELETKAAQLRQHANQYRERANQLHDEQFSIWDSVAEETDSMSALGLSLEEAD